MAILFSLGSLAEQLRAHRDDVADHDDGGRLEFLLAGVGGKFFQRRNQDALFRRRRRGDHRGRRLRREAGLHQLSRDPLQIVHHHVEHDRLSGARERRPIEILVGAVAGGENDGAIDAAQRRRDRRRRQRRKPRGDAGNDAERHAGGGKRHRLLAAAAEHERIAALEPQHALARARQRDQALADIGLRRRRLAAALAGEFEPRLRAGERQHPLIDQRVMHDDVGLGEAGERVERQQAGIARPGAGQPDVPGAKTGTPARRAAKASHAVMVRSLARRGDDRGAPD